jgi:NAD(P)-dependent dehydrogenase (short-subunit alcohol dehydrogenase family)
MPVAVVTGASDGIGAAVAGQMLDAGWQVALLARRAERLAAVAGGRAGALPVVCDVTDPAAVEAAFDRAVAAFGRIDVLFNNAGVFTPAGLIDEIPLDDWAQSVAVNVTGMFLCARAAFARMRRQVPQGGRIINNGSISAHSPRPGSVCYTTTKHAVTGLTRTLALDGRPYGIAAGQIDIGNARTALLDAHIARLKAADPAAEVPPTIDVATAAASVLHMASLPPEANVLTMTVMATTMPFVGRG